MPFPATVGGRTFTLADFDEFAYIAGLPDSVECIGDHGSRRLLGTSTSTFTMAVGSVVLVTNPERAFVPNMWLTVAHSATSYGTAIVLAYDVVTGDLEIEFVSAGDIVAGSTYSSWILYPVTAKNSETTCNPLPVSRGGVGRNYTASATTRFQDDGAGVFNCGNPSYNMQEVMDDFNQANPLLPYTAEKSLYNNGYVVRSKDTDAYMLSGVDYATNLSTQMMNRPGQFAMRVKNADSSISLTHGESGYMSLNSGGSIYFAIALKHAFAVSGEDLTTLAGLRSHRSSFFGNIFDFAGIGFRRTSRYQYDLWECLVCNNGVVQALPLFTNAFSCSLGFRADPNNKVVEFFGYTGNPADMFTVIPLATLPLPEALLDTGQGSLVHPAVSFQKNLGSDPKILNCDYLYCAKNLRRD